MPSEATSFLPALGLSWAPGLIPSHSGWWHPGGPLLFSAWLLLVEKSHTLPKVSGEALDTSWTFKVVLGFLCLL